MLECGFFSFFFFYYYYLKVDPVAWLMLKENK